MAPQVGLEPTTLRLTAGCSAIELLRSSGTDGRHYSRMLSPVNMSFKWCWTPNFRSSLQYLMDRGMIAP